MSRILCLASLAAAVSLADPPGAMVPVKIQVPAALRNGIFAQDRYLNLPPGFQIALFARVPGARFMATAPDGDILVSQPGSETITLLRPDPNGGIPRAITFASGLNQPQGMVFHTVGSTTYLYVSESQQVSRYIYSSGDTAAHDGQVVVSNLPGGGSHPLKNIGIDSNHKLYVSIASSCNVCTEDTTTTPQRSAIYVYEPDGSGGRLFAQGLRNAEGLAFVPGSNQLWVVVNHRDDVPYPAKDASGNYGKVTSSYVDNHPPDLFTSVRDGGNYGWPFCNPNPDSGFDKMPFDQDYDTNRDGHVNCAGLNTPDKGIQAHSAPLGLSFLQGSGFATPYLNGAVVGLHGSWDRSTPTGYKVIWYPMNGGVGKALDLVSGWLDDSTHQYWGRPVAAVVDGSGGLLISDDSAGAIYRLTYAPTAVSAASGYALLAPESIASVFGTNLASQTVAADSPQWPTTLGGVSVSVLDSRGTARMAPLAYVSPDQINFEIPAGTAPGSVNLAVRSTAGPVQQGTVTIVTAAPSLYSANGTGVGPAAATAVRIVLPGNLQSSVPVYTCPTGPPACATVPIALGVDTPVFLSFYGTGIRGSSQAANVQMTIGGVNAPILYAGPQGTWPGLDQINVGLPLSLRGAGQVDVVFSVDGQTSNSVQIAVQ